MQYIGKSLIVFGIALVIIGILLSLGGKISWLGRPFDKLGAPLPGDIVIQKKNFSFYFPVTTCILISIVLSAIFYLFFRHR